jgi:hypothetical protein
MNMVSLIVQLVCGAIGGNVAGAALKNFNLGPLGNTISGIVGGGIGGQILSAILGGGAATAAAGAAGGAMDPSAILSNVAGGGVGGAIVMIIVGLIRSRLGKSS